MIDTVIFDLGKVLVDFHPEAGMKKIGFSDEAVKVFNEHIFNGLWEECDRYPYEDDEIRAIFKKKVPGYEREVDMLWDNLHAITGARGYSVAWLKGLKDRGLKLYILSNFGKRAFEINSEIYPFLALVDGMVISYEVQVVKPDRRIYDIIAEKYSIVRENAVFIDDRQVNVDGAVEAGFRGILFESYEQTKTALDMLINS